jgi:hypothetical protein
LIDSGFSPRTTYITTAETTTTSLRYGSGLRTAARAVADGLGLLEFLLDAVPGIVLRLHSGLLAAGYWTTLHRPGGPEPMDDQHLAGAPVWFFGEAGDIPFLVAALVAWVRADNRRAASAPPPLMGNRPLGVRRGSGTPLRPATGPRNR